MLRLSAAGPALAGLPLIPCPENVMPRPVRLVSWNVNGFRALSAKPDWASLVAGNADVIALQETKAEAAQIPDPYREPEGWRTSWLGATVKKGYSGVALFIRRGIAGLTPAAVHAELPDPRFQGEGRLLHADFPAFHFLNVYFPNGSQSPARLAYKMAYYDAFLDYAEDLRREKPVVVCGDFNTAHRPVDLAHPEANSEHSGFLPEERAWMDRFIAAGYVDTFRHAHGEEAGRYTWWSYRRRARQTNAGWRIDYFFVSAELLPALRDAWIDAHVLGSDHCPVGISLELDDNAFPPGRNSCGGQEKTPPERGEIWGE